MAVQGCTVDLPTVTRCSFGHGVPRGVVFDTMDDGFSGHSSRFSRDSSVVNVVSFTLV